MSKRYCGLIVFVLGCLIAVDGQSLLACRYNVRETGFVDLGIEAYRLYCFSGSETSAEAISEFERLADGVLTDSRVVYEIVNLDSESDHPVLKYLDSSGELVPSKSKAILFSPGGSQLEIAMNWQDGIREKTLEPSLEKLIHSPLRSRIIEEIATAYAVVLIIEGESSVENQRVAEAAAQAMKVIEEELEFMPKPINKGPVALTLKQEDLADEEYLLWSFGLESSEISQPHAAILYGRGRWIGPLLRGEEIDEDILINILSVVGADCECGLDPRIIRGVGLPVAWNDSLQTIVADDLGFDPDNPMVRIEVSQIMRVSSLVYPRLLSEARAAESKFDSPVPYVDDDEAGSPDESESPFVLRNFLYVLALMTGLVIAIGVFNLIKSKRTE